MSIPGYEIIQAPGFKGGYEYIGIIGTSHKTYGLKVSTVSPQMFYNEVYDWIEENYYGRLDPRPLS